MYLTCHFSFCESYWLIKQAHKLVLTLYVGIVLPAYNICRCREHQGVAEELKGSFRVAHFFQWIQGTPHDCSHRSPTCFSVVSLPWRKNYLSVTLIFMFFITELTSCACILESFYFSNSSVKFILSSLWL